MAAIHLPPFALDAGGHREPVDRGVVGLAALAADIGRFRKDHHRAAGNGDTGRDRLPIFSPLCRIESQSPPESLARLRWRHRHGRLTPVEPQAEPIRRRAASWRFVKREAEDGQAVVAPVIAGHRLAIGLQPCRIGNPAAIDGGTRQKPVGGYRRMGTAELRELRYEIDQRPIGIGPVQPCRLIVLGIGIVVAPLRAAEFIAGRQHGRAAREQQRGEQRALIPLPAFIDAGVIGRPFCAVVPGNLVAAAVAILLAVRPDCAWPRRRRGRAG